MTLTRMNIGWAFIFLSALIWSGINPRDYPTWLLEVFPALAAAVLVGVTFNKFRLTRLAYILILVHSVILMIGGHYTYAEVPAFNWLKEHFELQRNNYDKIGHLAQGFIPAIVTREILLRKNVVIWKAWLNFIVVCICLAISATYELLEWLTAELMGESSEAFLGTQGYVWDTQSDMAFALLGAVLALLFLSRVHDRQLDLLSNVRSTSARIMSHGG